MRSRRVRNRRSARGSSSRERSASFQERTVRPPVVPTTDLHFGHDHVDVSSREGSRKQAWLHDAFVECRSYALTRRETSNSHDPAPSTAPVARAKISMGPGPSNRDFHRDLPGFDRYHGPAMAAASKPNRPVDERTDEGAHLIRPRARRKTSRIALRTQKQREDGLFES